MEYVDLTWTLRTYVINRYSSDIYKFKCGLIAVDAIMSYYSEDTFTPEIAEKILHNTCDYIDSGLKKDVLEAVVNEAMKCEMEGSLCITKI